MKKFAVGHSLFQLDLQRLEDLHQLKRAKMDSENIQKMSSMFPEMNHSIKRMENFKGEMLASLETLSYSLEDASEEEIEAFDNSDGLYSDPMNINMLEILSEGLDGNQNYSEYQIETKEFIYYFDGNDEDGDRVKTINATPFELAQLINTLSDSEFYKQYLPEGMFESYGE